MKYDERRSRFNSFTLPPLWEGALDAQLMAEAGFVYTGQKDLVYCFSCNIKLDGWTKHMDPLLRHKEESPTCSFVRQQLQAIKGEKKKVKSVVAPSKPLNPRQTASLGQLKSQASTLATSKPIHTVVTGLDDSRSSYAGRRGNQYSLSTLPINVENFSSESERIRSFIGWPLNESVHPEQLARVGFVYTGEGSLVQCFQCGVRYRTWLKGDVPLSVHQKCNPRCAFLHMLTNRDKSSVDKLPNRSSIPDSLSLNVQQSNVTLEFPDFADQATRLQSFKYWGGVLPKEELAEAGFYMIARRDVVKCFSCHVVLQDWERTDNVIEEHQRHSPGCEFLKIYQSNMFPSSPKSTNLIPRGSLARKPIKMKIKDRQKPQNNDTLLSLSSLTNSKEPSGDEALSISGILYPPSWSSNPPSLLSPPPGGWDSKEYISTRKKFDFNASTSLQSSASTSNSSKSKQLVVVSWCTKYMVAES